EAAAKAIDRATAKRRRAVLLTAKGLTLEHGDAETALGLARQAAKLAPALVPAAALAARLEARHGSMRRAQRAIERAWTVSPHPELAETWGALRLQDTAKARLARIRVLAGNRPDHPEAAMALARAAIDAQEFLGAREAL